MSHQTTLRRLCSLWWREGMRYGEHHAKAARAHAARKKTAAAKRKTTKR
jgi:hypothetical protein